MIAWVSNLMFIWCSFQDYLGDFQSSCLLWTLTRALWGRLPWVPLLQFIGRLAHSGGTYLHFFKEIFFFPWCGPFLVFIEFVTILLLLYVLVFWPRGMRDLSSLTRDLTSTLCIGRWSLNHWTAREVPILAFWRPWLYQFLLNPWRISILGHSSSSSI